MRLWGYYAWHTFINTIKKLFTSTALIIILAIFGFGVIGGLTAVVVEHAVDTKNATEIETQTQEAAEDEEEDEKGRKDVTRRGEAGQGAGGSCFGIGLSGDSSLGIVFRHQEGNRDILHGRCQFPFYCAV